MRISLNKGKPALPGRRTRERELVLDCAMQLEGHVSAEEICQRLARQGRRVSRATVYRTLDLLVEHGLLQRVQLDERGGVYEVLAGRAPHAHLYCLGCGRLVDFALPVLETLPRQVQRRAGFRAEHLLLRICGYCRRCRRARR